MVGWSFLPKVSDNASTCQEYIELWIIIFRKFVLHQILVFQAVRWQPSLSPDPGRLHWRSQTWWRRTEYLVLGFLEWSFPGAVFSAIWWTSACVSLGCRWVCQGFLQFEASALLCGASGSGWMVWSWWVSLILGSDQYQCLVATDYCQQENWWLSVGRFCDCRKLPVPFWSWQEQKPVKEGFEL